MVGAVAVKRGLVVMVGCLGWSWDLALGLIIWWVIGLASKFSTLAWWADTVFGGDFEVNDVFFGEVYAGMGWLVACQDVIEKQLAVKHLDSVASPSWMALFDLFSSWMAGRCCDLVVRGYFRGAKKNSP